MAVVGSRDRVAGCGLHVVSGRVMKGRLLRPKRCGSVVPALFNPFLSQSIGRDWMQVVTLFAAVIIVSGMLIRILNSECYNHDPQRFYKKITTNFLAKPNPIEPYAKFYFICRFC